MKLKFELVDKARKREWIRIECNEIVEWTLIPAWIEWFANELAQIIIKLTESSQIKPFNSLN